MKNYILLLSLLSAYNIKADYPSFIPSFIVNMIKCTGFSKKAEEFKKNFLTELAKNDQLLSNERVLKLVTTYFNTTEENRKKHANILENVKNRHNALYALPAIEVLKLFKNKCSQIGISNKEVRFGEPIEGREYTHFFGDYTTPNAFKAFEELQKEYSDCF